MAKPKLALIPATQGSKLYSVLPADGVGDFTFSRNSAATRINKDGLIETVAVGKSRLNYPLIDGVVNGCPSHLLEPSRLQKIQYSEAFDNAYWTKNGSSVVSGFLSPKGDLSAFKLVEGTTTGAHYMTINLSRTSGLEYSYSVYVKSSGRDIFNLSANSAINADAFFNISNGTVDVTTGSAKIEQIGDYYRCSITGTATTTGVATFYVTLSTSGNVNNYQGNGTSGIYIWGAQVEQGSYPTSYIPNYGTSAGITRVAETANGAGDASTFNDSEGVLMAEISALANDGTFRTISINGTPTNVNEDRIQIYYRNTADIINFGMESGNSTQFFSQFPLDVKSNNKLALKYSASSCSFWINGIKVGEELNKVMPTDLSRLDFNIQNGSDNFYGNTKQIQYFDSALNDSDLEKITSWTSFTDLANGQLYSIK